MMEVCTRQWFLDQLWKNMMELNAIVGFGRIVGAKLHSTLIVLTDHGENNTLEVHIIDCF